MLWYAPIFGVLWLVNAWYARRRHERALANGVSSVVQSCLMIFVLATVADAPLHDVVPLFMICLAYFVGTVFYVKTMIREHGNTRLRRWSLAVHAIAVGVCGWLDVTFAALFTWFLVRAGLLPRQRLTPKQIGFIEIGNSILLLAAISVTFD